MRRYNEQGPSALGDQRCHNPGQAPLLDGVQRAQLWQALQTPPGDEDLSEAEVTAWAEDEHRVGLHPVNRMVWVPLGRIPIAQVNWKYQWLWLVGFVEPRSRQTYWWIVPRLNWQVFSQVLADFAAHFDLGPRKRVVQAFIRGLTGFHWWLDAVS